nr:nuclear factor NF-kappa-B p100 subunit isoform X2 [Parasteatoda tepidariorum]
MFFFIFSVAKPYIRLIWIVWLNLSTAYYYYISDDIEIVFFSLDKDQNEDWKENAKFLPTDVHHQVAIYFRTPPFKENIDKDVFIQLRNKSNGMKSNEVKFHYLRCHELEPESIVQQTKKRKRLDLPEGYLGLKPPLSMSQISTILGESFNDDKPSNELSVEIKDSLTFNSFDEVDFDGLIDNLASLNIKEKTSEGIMNKSCSSEAEQEQMLKSSVINQIKESKKDKFFKFLPTLIAFEDESENNILHLFVLEESEDVSLLLKMLEYAPIDLLNQVNKMHMTPLLIAVSKNLWKIVRILLKHGADPKVKDKNGNNCVHLAAMFNFPFCMREVLASLLGDSTQKYLLDINGLNYDGLAPLHLSIISNSEICTKLLFEANANANITDGKSGKTPLHFAYERSPDLIAILRTQSRNRS